VVVGVFDPPEAGAGGGVEAEVFPGAPEGVDAGEGFGVFPQRAAQRKEAFPGPTRRAYM
jgi:hypothetical protein